MTTKTRLLAASMLTTMAVVAGGAAFAASSNPVTQTGGMDVRMPLGGSTQRVSIAIDASTGGLSSVTIDPSSGFVATKVGARRVTFRNSSVPVKLEVGLDGDSLDAKLSARTLDTVAGTGSWSSNLFGSGLVTVPYTVGKDAGGQPTFALGALTAPASVTVSSSGTATRPNKAGGWASFTAGGFTKTVTFSVKTSHEDSPAVLEVTLSADARQVLPLAALAGARTWTGPTCDGVTNSLAYVVNPDGTFGNATATPTATRLRVDSSRIKAQFPNHAKVELRLQVAGTNGVLVVDEKGASCRSLPAPTVNAVVGTNLSHDRGDDHGGKSEHQGNDQGQNDQGQNDQGGPGHGHGHD